MTAGTLFIAELTVYDPGIPGTRVLRYATGQGFVTRPSETPANTYFDTRIQQPASVTRTLFDDGTTQGRSQVGFGDLVLLNGDGALDGLLAYGFDGRPLTIRQGTPGAAYPSGFTTVLVGTMDQPEFGADTVTVKLRDRQAELDVALQGNKYAGTNALPAGLEGVASDLKGKPKPLVFGSVSNITPPLVNSARLIYQVHDGAVGSIASVYDNGVALQLPGDLVLRQVYPNTLSATGVLANNMRAALWMPGTRMWVVGGQSGATFGGILQPTMLTSADRVTWTPRDPRATGDVNCLAYGDAICLAGCSQGQVSYSRDLVTWTAVTVAGTSIWFHGAAFGAHIFVVGGDQGNLFSSADGGLTWTSRTSQFGTTAIRAITYGGGMFVAVGDSGKLSSSPDGVTWTSRTSQFGSTSIRAIGYGAGRFVAVGDSGKISWSLDGITWTAASTIWSFFWGSVVYSHDRFVVGGGGGEILYSPDAVTWTISMTAYLDTSGPPNAGPLAGIAYNGEGEYVVVSSAIGYIEPGTGLNKIANLALGVGEATGRMYATQADVLDDTQAPAPGAVGVYFAGGLFRLGAIPAGTITADVLEGATAADRTAAQVYKRVLLKAGKSSGDYSASDLTALDAITSAVVGIYVSDETTVPGVLDLIANSAGAWWGVDRTGVFRIQRFAAPSGTPAASFTANDLLERLARGATSDPGRGVPITRANVCWGRNYTVQSGDLAGSVSADRRAFLALDWRVATASDPTVLVAHLLAQQTNDDTLLTVEADAVTEASRRLTLRSVRRDRFELVVAMTPATTALDLNQVIKLTHPRFGLSGGKLFRIIGVAPDATKSQVTFTVWG